MTPSIIIINTIITSSNRRSYFPNSTVLPLSVRLFQRRRRREPRLSVHYSSGVSLYFIFVLYTKYHIPTLAMISFFVWEF